MLSTRANAEQFFAQGRAVVDASARAIAGAAARPDFEAISKAEKQEEPIGRRIGRYKLLQLIGEGGCGVVYMAEQSEPVRRRVALKIIKLGMDTKSVIARFDAERQALVMMDHPNIARVLDAGATETGRPYFVMELVRGFEITECCDENKLDTRQRLDLFIQVCNAIQHAHQKGVIHRDIKPSNILVTLHDGKPVPKVIDFGIATAYDQAIGTPAYMSPEPLPVAENGAPQQDSFPCDRCGELALVGGWLGLLEDQPAGSASAESAKAALRGLTNSYPREWAPRNDATLRLFYVICAIALRGAFGQSS